MKERVKKKKRMEREEENEIEGVYVKERVKQKNGEKKRL